MEYNYFRKPISHREEYMQDALEDYMYKTKLRNEGYRDGIKYTYQNIVMNMVNENVSYYNISKATRLSIPEIEEIVKSKECEN